MIITEAQKNAAFERLEVALAKVQLSDDSGQKRTASADEFMLMPGSRYGAEWWAFKHCDSRNYLFVHRTRRLLKVPATPEAFMRGTFEKFPPIGEAI
jgi:hypothetical protein